MPDHPTPANLIPPPVPPRRTLSLEQEAIANFIRKHPDFRGIPNHSFRFINGTGWYSSVKDSFCIVKNIKGEECFIKCSTIDVDAETNAKEYAGRDLPTPREEAFANYLAFKVQNYKCPDVDYYEDDSLFVYISRHFKHQSKGHLNMAEYLDPEKVDLDNFIRKCVKDWFVLGTFDNKLENSVITETGDGDHERLKLYTIDIIPDLAVFDTECRQGLYENDFDIIEAFIEELRYVTESPKIGVESRMFYSKMLKRIEEKISSGETDDRMYEVILPALQKLEDDYDEIKKNIKSLRDDKSFQALILNPKLREESDAILNTFEKNAFNVSRSIKEITSDYNEQNPENHILSYKEQREEKQRDRAKQMTVNLANISEEPRLQTSQINGIHVVKTNLQPLATTENRQDCEFKRG